MNEKRTTARAFHDAGGVDDWRVLFSGAHAYFRAGSFGEGARFVAAIADVAGDVDHFPDVDLRPEGVTVRIASGEYGSLSQLDVELARRISVEARTLQLESDPSQVQVVGIDGSLDRLRDARGRHANAPLVQAQLPDLPFAPASFDGILLAEVLEHVTDAHALLQALHHLLRPGGVLAISVPHAQYPRLWDPINATWTALGGRPIRSGPRSGHGGRLSPDRDP